MHIQTSCAIAALMGAAGLAFGQNLVVYDVDKTISTADSYRPDLSTAPSVAVGEARVVVMGSHRMMLFDKALPINPLGPPSLLDSEDWATPLGLGGGVPPTGQYGSYPFQPATPLSLPLFVPGLTFPRADYDPITGNVWMLYGESIGDEFAGPPFLPARPEAFPRDCTKRLHLAASKHPLFDNFDDGDPDGFEYITGTDSIRLDLLFTEFRPTGEHGPFGTDLYYPSFGFDTDDVFIAAMDRGECAVFAESGIMNNGQTILVIPRKFGTPLTDIHAGGRPDESDITVIRMNGLDVPDPCFQMLAVQEPYEQYDNVTLFISTDGAQWVLGSANNIQAIRLRGVFRDASGTLQVRQSLEEPSPAVFQLDDADIPAGFDDLVPSFGFANPPTIYPEAPSFDPTVDNGAFHTALLTEDNQGNPRVFAAHAARKGDRWAVQWYVIDPKLNQFHTTTIPSDDWNPEIVAVGRITTDGAAEPTTGDCYHPVLGVTRSGRVFIEYTFSNGTTDQRILRAQISNTYTAVGTTATLQAGPSSGYGALDDRWALYADMQTDPTGCTLWSTHTLVDNAMKRDVWLFSNPFNCFTTDLNASESTNLYDMAIYSDLFLQGHRRADTDADDVVDASDMATFIDAYNDATGP